ncbi:MAG: glucosyl-3-phosphoglycerate synthase [Thermoplasmatales archaeon SG8-52-3]|nr:MAG: glucosyl-3-phosphoglycerate synthase [Thermoplasmatales archaeon SG8-52-3]
MDIKQDEITTLHELCVDKNKLLKSVSDAACERPVSVIMPMLYREIKSDALKNILKGLNRCTYLNEIVIPLAAKNEREFRQVKRFFSDLKIPKLIMWCNGPRVDKLLNELKLEGLNLLKYSGKGRDVWLAMGIASIKSYAFALHDADVLHYDEMIPSKLLYPIIEPELDFKFNKGYYARVNMQKKIIFGRVFRLFLHPLLRAFVDNIGCETDFVRFLRSFRYPISGEFALTSDLARDVDLPGDWGIEIGIMSEMYRIVSLKNICQTDLGFYDHKHQPVGSVDKGLLKMTGDILKTLLRVLIEEDHLEISKENLISLRVLYVRHARDCIRKYHADAHFNSLNFDRHLEETMVEKFSQQIMNAGISYMRKPVGTRIPDWLRTLSARRKIREQLLEIVIDDNK